jgi:hypothetical protein
MPFEINWYQDQRIIHLRFYGDITIEDVGESTRAVNTFVQSGVPLVHNIEDMTDVTKFPNNIVKISQQITPIDNTLMGWTIIVGANQIVTFIASTVSQLAQARFRAVKTFDEAAAFLKGVDITAFSEDDIAERA